MHYALSLFPLAESAFGHTDPAVLSNFSSLTSFHIALLQNHRSVSNLQISAVTFIYGSLKNSYSYSR